MPLCSLSEPSAPALLKAISIGGWEALVLVVIVLILFGPSKLPLLGDSLGKGIQNFKRAFQAGEAEEAEVVRAEALPEEPRVQAPKETEEREESRQG